MRSRFTRVALSMFTTFTFSATAFAQAPGKVATEESGWLVWVVLGGAGLIILVTGFINPKRSHLS